MSVLFLFLFAVGVARGEVYSTESSISGEQAFLDTSPRTVTVYNEYNTELFVFFDDSGEHTFLVYCNHT